MEEDHFSGRKKKASDFQFFFDAVEKEETCFASADDFEALINFLIEKEDYTHALKACAMALEQYPVSSEIMIEYAHCHLHEGDPEAALEMIENASTLQPYNSDIAFIKSNALNQLGRHKEALSYLEEMEPLVSDKEQIWHGIALCYQYSGNIEEAIEWHKKVLEVEPGHEGSLFELAYCYQLSDDLDHSIEYYTRFLKEDPFNESAWLQLGICYSSLHKFEEALNAFNYCLAINNESGAWFNLGHTYMNLERYPEAEEHYQKSLEIEGRSAMGFTYLAASQEQQDKFLEAMGNYREAIREEPHMDDAWYGSGMCLMGLDKNFEAIHFLRKAVKLKPTNELYWAALGKAEFKVGNVTSAIEAFEEAFAIDGLNPDLFLDWSFVFYDQGDYLHAYELIEKGLSESPQDARLYYRGTVYLLAEGEYSKAMDFLNKALFLDYDGHVQLFEFFTEIRTQKMLFRIIEQYKRDHLE